MKTLLESSKGEIKTLIEWQEEAKQFFASVCNERAPTPKDYWERYSKILGLVPLGATRDNDRVRKPYHCDTNGKHQITVEYFSHDH